VHGYGRSSSGGLLKKQTKRGKFESREERPEVHAKKLHGQPVSCNQNGEKPNCNDWVV